MKPLRRHFLALPLLLLALTSARADRVTLIDTNTPGFYNEALGNLLDGTSPAFPASGDPSLDFTNAPNLSAAQSVLGNWLAYPPTLLPPHWSTNAVSIPRYWPVGTESAIVYRIDAPTGGYLDARLRFGVDNGVFVWFDGQFLGGAMRPGGASLGEHQFVLPHIPAGQHYLQILREDHGNTDDYLVEVTAEPAETVLFGNLTQPNNSAGPQYSTWYAQSFLTDSRDYYLSRATLGMGTPAAANGGFFVALYADSGALQPGARLTQLAGTSDPARSGNYLYTPTASVLLTSNTVYWLVMGTTVPGSHYRILDEENTVSLELGASYGMSHSGNQGATWTPVTTQTLLSLEVSGQALPPPPPIPPYYLTITAGPGFATLQAPANSAVYYVIHAGTNLARLQPWAMAKGSSGPSWQIPYTPGPQAAFFRAERISSYSPGDRDGDGMDDMYELDHPGVLDPLNPADAALDPDGDGLTHLQEYWLVYGCRTYYGEAISREVSTFNLDPKFNDAISREVSLWGQDKGFNEAISREVSYYGGEHPSHELYPDAISREVSLWGQDQGFNDAISREVSLYGGERPGHPDYPDAISREVSLWGQDQGFNDAISREVSVYNYLPGVIPDSCAAAPANLVAWFQGENSTTDHLGGPAATRVGDVTYQDGRVGKAFHFPAGTNYLLSTDLLAGRAEGTVELWFKAETWDWQSVSSSAGLTLWAATAAPPPDGGHDVMLLGTHNSYTTNGEIMFGLFVTNGVAPGWKLAKSGLVPQPGAWYHLAGTWGPSGMRIYINGELRGTDAFAGPAPAYATQNVIGHSSWPDTGIRGLVDEVSLYHRALTATEIQSLYLAGSAGKCVPCNNCP